MDSIPPKCRTPNFCLPGFPIESLCHACQIEIEEVAIRSAMNMGAPDRFGCGICGYWYDNPEFFAHPCIQENKSKIFTPEQEEEIDKFLEEHRELMDRLSELEEKEKQDLTALEEKEKQNVDS